MTFKPKIRALGVFIATESIAPKSIMGMKLGNICIFLRKYLKLLYDSSMWAYFPLKLCHLLIDHCCMYLFLWMPFHFIQDSPPMPGHLPTQMPLHSAQALIPHSESLFLRLPCKGVLLSLTGLWDLRVDYCSSSTLPFCVDLYLTRIYQQFLDLNILLRA